MDLLTAARDGDNAAFDELVAPYRRELHAHCYRMLGSVHDADDALQEALVGAWRGLRGFEGRSSVRSWLYRIATNACLRLGGRRQRILATEYLPARGPAEDIGEPVTEVSWLEPYPSDPAAQYEQRESVELAFVAALQHLPATQRAVLILREVLSFSAAEVADLLDTTVVSVNSALQRARASLSTRVPERSQQAMLSALGDERTAALVDTFVTAWERSDVEALRDLLVDDARFAMPPLPAWFAGRENVLGFFATSVFAAPWRLVRTAANGQLAFGCYQDRGGDWENGVVNVVTLRDDRIAEITGFLDPAMYEAFELPKILAAGR